MKESLKATLCAGMVAFAIAATPVAGATPSSDNPTPAPGAPSTTNQAPPVENFVFYTGGAYHAADESPLWLLVPAFAGGMALTAWRRRKSHGAAD